MKRQIAEESKILFSNVCYASFPRGFIFRANGKIEKCTVVLDNPKNQVGVVDPIKGVLIDEEKNSKWGGRKTDSKCYRCKNILNCLNLCCYKGITIDGEPKEKLLCENRNISINFSETDVNAK